MNVGALRCSFCLIDNGGSAPTAEYVVNGWSCCPRHAELAATVYGASTLDPHRHQQQGER